MALTMVKAILLEKHSATSVPTSSPVILKYQQFNELTNSTKSHHFYMISRVIWYVLIKTNIKR